MKTKTLVLVVALFLAACSRAPQPLVSGDIVFVTMGDRPVMRAGEIGSWSSRTFTEGRVEIYERLVVIIEKNGTRHAAPPDWFSQLDFK